MRDPLAPREPARWHEVLQLARDPALAFLCYVSGTARLGLFIMVVDVSCAFIAELGTLAIYMRPEVQAAYACLRLASFLYLRIVVVIFEIGASTWFDAPLYAPEMSLQGNIHIVRVALLTCVVVDLGFVSQRIRRVLGVLLD